MLNVSISAPKFNIKDLEKLNKFCKEESADVYFGTDKMIVIMISKRTYNYPKKKNIFDYTVSKINQDK